MHDCGICIIHIDMRSTIHSCSPDDMGMPLIQNMFFLPARGIPNMPYKCMIILPRQDYHTFIGHVRYATRGQKEHVLDEGHPHVIGGTRVDCGTHIYMYDADAAIVHNGQVDMTLLEKHIDRAALRTGCDTEALLYYYKNTNERAVLANIPGSFTMAIADRTKKYVMILRD